MYDNLINYILEEGKKLKKDSGKTKDIGVTKQWLTEQDIRIEKGLSEIIKSNPGDHSIFAEELHADYLAAQNTWVIDPISHTFNFLRDLPHYAIVLSHMIEGVLQFSVVYDPSLDELFLAKKGKGTTLNGNKVSVSDRLTDLAVLYDPYPLPGYNPNGNFKLFGDLFSIGRVKSFGSFGLHYAYLACGRVDIVVARNKDTFPEFAGKILIEEAGGILTDMKGNELQHNTEGIIAANNSDNHAKILKLVSTLSI